MMQASIHVNTAPVSSTRTSTNFRAYFLLIMLLSRPWYMCLSISGLYSYPPDEKTVKLQLWFLNMFSPSSWFLPILAVDSHVHTSIIQHYEPIQILSCNSPCQFRHVNFGMSISTCCMLVISKAPLGYISSGVKCADLSL